MEIATHGTNNEAVQGDPGEAVSTSRRCVVCGYDLHGLGDEPRCPECGLQNIPEAFQRDVWQHVDGFRFMPFRFGVLVEKRMPGWWWALDRPGDLSRSAKFAAFCVILAWVSIFLVLQAGDAVEVITSDTHTCELPGYSKPFDGGTYTCFAGIGGRNRGGEGRIEEGLLNLSVSKAKITTTTTRELAFVWPEDMSRPAGLVALWVIMVWACPTLAGIWTQIRRGLPEYAYTPGTIIAAANYEAYRLLYMAGVIVGLVLLETTLRVVTRGEVLLHERQLVWLLLIPLGYGVASWIGPLRSDHTKQLVRSRGHAIRMLIMYGVLFPPIAVFIIDQWIGRVFF